MIDTQPSLLTWPAAPTTSGPRTAASDGERTRATSRERWDAWTTFNANHARAILEHARYLVAEAILDGRRPRISAKALAEWFRATQRVSFNNSATAGLGEWLAEHEDLRPYVERRGVK